MLLVSHPPHGPQPDVAKAARLLGLAAPDLALKAHYAIPEIWAADQGEAGIRTLADGVRAAGFHVSMVPGAALAEIPAHLPIHAVSCTAEGLALAAEGGRYEVAWDAGVIGVYHTPRTPQGVVKPATRPSRETVLEHGAACDIPFFDMYHAEENRLIRLVALPEQTDFSGLPDLGSPSPAGRLAKFVHWSEERFRHGRVDRRLLNMQARHWPPPSTLGAQQLPRTGLSFASHALGDLLFRIDPALVNISHCEFSSRLVYLTWRLGD
jgi:hypothetical protein